MHAVNTKPYEPEFGNYILEKEENTNLPVWKNDIDKNKQQN